MKKFLHFGMVIVIVVLFFCVKCNENKKALFLVLLLLFEYIWLQSTKPQNWKKKLKKNVGRNFGKNDDYSLLAEWRGNAWIMALFVFFSKFLPFFFFRLFVEFFVFDDHYVIYWKTNTITLQNETFFFNSSLEKIKQRLRWPGQNVEILHLRQVKCECSSVTHQEW